MKGIFRYVDKNGKLLVVDESDLIPADAKELIRFHVEPPPSPHTQEDHDIIDAISAEFSRVYHMIYNKREYH